MKVIRCESGLFLNADYIKSVNVIYQQGYNRYAVVVDDPNNKVFTLCRCDSEQEAQSVMNVLYNFLGHPDWTQINMELVKKGIGEKDEPSFGMDGDEKEGVV